MINVLWEKNKLSTYLVSIGRLSPSLIIPKVKRVTDFPQDALSIRIKGMDAGNIYVEFRVRGKTKSSNGTFSWCPTFTVNYTVGTKHHPDDILYFANAQFNEKDFGLSLGELDKVMKDTVALIKSVT